MAPGVNLQRSSTPRNVDSKSPWVTTALLRVRKNAVMLSRRWFHREFGAVRATTSTKCIMLAASAVLALTGCAPVRIGESQPAASASATDEWDNDEDQFEFGQSAHYLTDDEIPLVIRVSTPVDFTPSKRATVIEREFGGPRKGLQASTVYYTVTITNESATKVYDADFLFSNVDTSAFDEEDEVWRVEDGDSFLGTSAAEHLKPGRAITFRDAFTVPTSTQLAYELSFDGLAGRTLTWSSNRQDR